MSPDNELVSDYAAKGSESAFRALVQRHVDLVYATAIRQVGDPGMAEEITQNVFIILARKSPRLAGKETLAGWLHKTAVLESKARIRSEIRRRHREDEAIRLATLSSDGKSLLDPLVPLVDEALLDLRESDRLALILRYMEDRSLRDVGNALGINEDAARKRVSRALEHVTEFFRKHGFATISATALLTASSAKAAAPVSLVTSSVNAGLAAKETVSSLGTILFHLMTLTKTQTALLCSLAVAVPLTVQWQAEARLAKQLSDASANYALLKQSSQSMEKEVTNAQSALAKAQANELNAQARLDKLRAQAKGNMSIPVYHWDDNASMLRISKKALESVRLPAFKNKKCQLTDQIKETLQLTDSESSKVQGTVDHFLDEVDKAQTAKPTEPKKENLYGFPKEYARSFEVSGMGDQYSSLVQSLRNELNSTLGKDRAELMEKSISEMIPLDSDKNMISSAWVLNNNNYTLTFFKPPEGNTEISYQIKTDRCSMGSSYTLDELPEKYRSYLQDWINILKEKPQQPK